jgi:hypothetical protein
MNNSISENIIINYGLSMLERYDKLLIFYESKVILCDYILVEYILNDVLINKKNTKILYIDEGNRSLIKFLILKKIEQEKIKNINKTFIINNNEKNKLSLLFDNVLLEIIIIGNKENIKKYDYYNDIFYYNQFTLNNSNFKKTIININNIKQKKIFFCYQPFFIPEPFYKWLYKNIGNFHLKIDVLQKDNLIQKLRYNKILKLKKRIYGY